MHNWHHLWESPTKLWFYQDVHGRMFGGQLGSYVESGSGRSSRGSTWLEGRQKRHEDKNHEEEGQSGLGEGSVQTYWTMSDVSGRNRFDKRDEELE